MLTNILITIAAFVAALLVLLYVLVVLVSNQAFFGLPITLVLCACVAVLMLFAIYLAIARIVAMVKERPHNEDLLQEKHLENILTNEIALKQQTISMTAVNAAVKPSEGGSSKNEQRAKLEELAAARKKEEKEAIKAQKAAEQKRRQDEKEAARKAQEAEKQAQEAQKAARTARAKEAVQERERQIALKEAELQRQAAEDKAKELAEREAQYEQEMARLVKGKAQQEQQEKDAASLRRTQAIDNLRKQAEAAAQARRKAQREDPHTSGTASFPAVTQSGAMPVASAHTPPAEPTTKPAENIWDQMQVKQSAAPTLRQPQTLAGTPPVPQHTASQSSTGPTAAQRAAAQRLQQTGHGHLFNPGGLPVTTSFAAGAMPVQPNAAPAYVPPAAAPQAQAVAAPVKPATAAPTPTASAKHTAPSVASAKAPARPASVPKQPVQPPVAQAATPADGEQPNVKRGRGRPPKIRTPEEIAALNAPKRPRGRPPKVLTPEEIAAMNAPKRPRGRPPKVLTPEEIAAMNAPKRPRGRPRKVQPEDEGTANT